MKVQAQHMNQMQNMNQVQQMHQGQGQGPKGMGKIMKALSPDQRQEVSQTLQSMNETDRKNAVEQLKQLDVSNLSNDQLYQSVMDILNPTTQQNVISASSIDTYA